MLIAIAGDTHGELGPLYDCVGALEQEARRRVDLVLQVGDFGVWPDPARLDDATRRHGDSGGFRRLLQEGKVPRPTVFIAGNHEDFVYLERPTPPLPEGLRFLRWGEVMDLEVGGETLRVGGAGGCYGERDYGREGLSGAARRHYTAAELRKLAARGAGDLDVLLLHAPPAGTVTELHAPPGLRPRTWNLRGPGLAELVATVRPRVCFTGHIHARTERRINGVRTVGLNKVPYRGSVLLQEITPSEGEPRDIAEWGGAPEAKGDTWMAIDVEDPELAESLVALLEGWAARVLGGRAPSREDRKRLHAALAGERLRPVLMGALLGGDVRALLDRHVPVEDRAALLGAWDAGGLPDPAGLRST